MASFNGLCLKHVFAVFYATHDQVSQRACVGSKTEGFFVCGLVALFLAVFSHSRRRLDGLVPQLRRSAVEQSVLCGASIL